jgi:molecular chaperone DnaK
MPGVARFLKDMTGREIISHGDTDLAVAKGAAITAELYSSNATGLREGAMKITDVTAHSLGALSVSQDGTKFVNEIMIKKNSKVPSTCRKPFTIKPGNMTNKLEVYTLQGESRTPLDCNVLAKVVISGFYNDGRGPVIDIEYNYDENGIVNIKAFQGDDPLTIKAEPVPSDIRWMGGNPRDMPTDVIIAKNIAICVDLSRSMDGEPIEEAKKNIRNFIKTLSGEGTKFSLIGFGDKVKVIQELTDDTEVLMYAIDELKVKMLGRGTDASPLDTARVVIGNQPGVKIVVVLTDGIWGKRDNAVDQALACRNENITIIAVGLGDADTSFLRQIATVDDGALFTTIDRLGETFGTIATAIASGGMGLAVHESSNGLAVHSTSSLAVR